MYFGYQILISQMVCRCFLPSLGCLFTFWVVSFAQTVFDFIELNLSFQKLFGCAGCCSLHRLSLVAVSGALSVCCVGFSLQWLSCCGAWALGTGAQQFLDSRAQAQQLWHTGLVAPWHVESPQTRDQTCVSCIGRQVVNHWTTKEIPIFFSFCCDFSVIYKKLLPQSGSQKFTAIDSFKVFMVLALTLSF